MGLRSQALSSQLSPLTDQYPSTGSERDMKGTLLPKHKKVLVPPGVPRAQFHYATDRVFLAIAPGELYL